MNLFMLASPAIPLRLRVCGFDMSDSAHVDAGKPAQAGIRDEAKS